METSFYLLLFLAHLGIFDVLYFHIYKCRLHLRPECRREVFWHIWRHLIYGLQFLWVANFRFYGSALILLGALYFFDIFIAWSDVLEENRSRASQGGLPRVEYFMHIVLSLLVGLYMMATFEAIWSDRNLTSAIVYAPPAVPAILRIYMTAMGFVALGNFVYDFYKWLSFDPPAEVGANV
jgi:hypothetical protein